MEVILFTFGTMPTNCYIAFDKQTRDAVLIDVSDKIPDEYFKKIEENSLIVRYILITHGHYDHTLGVKKVKEVFPEAKVCISREDYTHISECSPHPFVKKELFLKPDILLEDFQVIEFGNEHLTVMSAPGHTSGGCAFYNDECIFTGDTVFKQSVGRTDFFTGSDVDIIRSTARILSLSGNRQVLPGHGELSTQEFERRNNPYYDDKKYTY